MDSTTGATSPVNEQHSNGEPPRDPQAVRDLIEQLRPAVQDDGGDLELVDVNVTTGVVRVRLTGACSSCAISTSTIQLGVERILKSRFPWITAVEGELDELDFDVSAALGRGGWVPLPSRRS